MSDSNISEWFYQYNKDIYHFLIYYTGFSDAEDLVQEGLLAGQQQLLRCYFSLC
ncbi:hypothetical protein [Radiobacillus sp. PE A8.2]|uniref:hypothetical protein n=1 Tax=Radiobacillus sp. PE A8.2 TaxID=3380349 RepID=UPI00388E7554